ncbi:MAG TPA: hypothetical protein PKN52_05665 [Trueperaceae bacterium]|nr:hypothetical protein [Trueperaceae bacterium]
MRQYSCSVRLAGEMLQVVTGKIVTVPEIAVLRDVHGADAVLDIRPADPVERDDATERERLRKRYDNPTPDSQPRVDRLFGPAFQPLPKTLREIGLDPASQAAVLRAQAEAAATAAALLENEPSDDTGDVDEMFGDDAPASKKAKAA